jgi:hypothetical protein
MVAEFQLFVEGMTLNMPEGKIFSTVTQKLELRS